MCLCVHKHALEPNISEMFGDRGSVPMEMEMAYGKSNGHVNDDLM